MNFKEAFEKYKSQTATEEEKQYVESEIEKSELIVEYILDKEPILKMEAESQSWLEDTGNRAQIQKIRRAINKKFVLYSFLTIAVVFFLLAGSYFILSPFKLSDKGDSDWLKDFDSKLAIYTELNLANQIVWSAKVEKEGFRQYRIEIDKAYKYNRVVGQLYHAEMKNGKWRNIGEDLKYTRIIYDEPFLKGNEDVNELEKLPATAYVTAAIGFENPIPMAEVLRLQNEYKDIEFFWWAIETGKNRNSVNYFQLGINTTAYTSGESFYDTLDSKKYPALNLYKLTSGGTAPLKAKDLELHFISMVKVMKDNPSFLKIFNQEKESYENALKYVEEGPGVNSYLTEVAGSPAALLEILNDSKVSGLVIKDVKVSKFSNRFNPE